MKRSIISDAERIREYVRERYGAIAEESDSTCGCAAASCCGAGEGRNYAERLGYSAVDLGAVPAGADLGLGCGNPLAIAGIKPGETILDLGSGAGFDCFLAARQLGGTGHVIGVDMAAAMISKARENAAASDIGNVEFRLGEIEALPIADTSVDLIISNCVINLSPEKERVFREAFRVLRPGGRLAIADIVATKPLPEALRSRLDSIGACVGGAMLVDDFRSKLTAAGFDHVDVTLLEPTRELIRNWTEDGSAGDYVVSAMITAVKASR